MPSSVRTVTFDAHDPYAIASFWAQALGTTVGADDHPGDPSAEVRSGGVTVLFELSPDTKTVKNRGHLDLEPDGPRDAEVEWLQTIGATVFADFREPDGTGWVTMQDPDGNEFCVLRSAAERAATS